MSITDWLLDVLLLLMMAVAFIDCRWLIVPDILTAAIALLAVPYLYFSGLNPLLALDGALLAGLVGLGLRWYFQRRLGRPALGRGDIKLMAALGLWVGLDGLPAFFIVAGLAGLVTAVAWHWLGRGRLFPFAPALLSGSCYILFT